MLKQPQQPKAPDQRKRQCSHNQKRFIEATESEIQQYENDNERGGNDDFELRRGALEKFELSRPRHGVTRWHLYVRRHSLLHVLHCGFEISTADVDIYPS